MSSSFSTWAGVCSSLGKGTGKDATLVGDLPAVLEEAHEGARDGDHICCALSCS